VVWTRALDKLLDRVSTRVAKYSVEAAQSGLVGHLPPTAKIKVSK